MVSKFHFGNYILGEIIKEEQNLLYRRYNLKQGKARNAPHVTQEPGQAGYINVKENTMTPHIRTHHASANTYRAPTVCQALCRVQEVDAKHGREGLCPCPFLPEQKQMLNTSMNK